MTPATRHVPAPRRRGLLAPLGLAVLVGQGACAAEGDVGSSSRVERLERGDTVVVRTLAGRAWSAPARLVEELRIGRLDGPNEEMFGPVLELAADREGGVYVFDSQAPALRHYDASGRYTRTLGRAGSGPGEYRDAALGLAVLSDGRVFMRDPRNARINIYAPSGEPAGQWPVASGLFTSRAMVVDTAGHAYLKILTGPVERNQSWPIGLLHMDPTGGVVDTVQAPRIDGEPATAGWTFTPVKVWEMSPLGDVVVGLSGIANGFYSFEVRRRDGSVLRVEKAHEPVSVHPEERAERESLNGWMRRNQGQHLTSDIPPVPAVKPAYHGFSFADDGSIWVHLHTPAEQGEPAEPQAVPGVEEPRPGLRWREPVVFDVFDRDGTYLGQVRVPPRTRLAAIGDDEVWGITRGDLDEPYVVRYRLVLDGDVHGSVERGS
jgi:hypothetical protein